MLVECSVKDFGTQNTFTKLMLKGAPQLSYPFIFQWTSRLLPCPSYCKQCCNEHWGTCVSFNSGFLGVYAQQWDCWVVWQFYYQFFKESPLWYIHTMEYYLAIEKNAFESVLMRCMKLEPIIQSEVSQKEKHHYSIITHIYGI